MGCNGDTVWNFLRFDGIQPMIVLTWLTLWLFVTLLLKLAIDSSWIYPSKMVDLYKRVICFNQQPKSWLVRFEYSSSSDSIGFQTSPAIYLAEL